jgi:hypothetical protein
MPRDVELSACIKAPQLSADDTDQIREPWGPLPFLGISKWRDPVNAMFTYCALGRG